MINSAQSIEGARFTPEKKLPINFEHISSTSHKSAITKVEEKLDQEKILDPINDESTVGSEQMQTVSQTQSPVSVQKFVLEVRNIFTKFVVRFKSIIRNYIWFIICSYISIYLFVFFSFIY